MLCAHKLVEEQLLNVMQAVLNLKLVVELPLLTKKSGSRRSDESRGAPGFRARKVNQMSVAVNRQALNLPLLVYL